MYSILLLYQCLLYDRQTDRQKKQLFGHKLLLCPKIKSWYSNLSSSMQNNKQVLNYGFSLKNLYLKGIGQCYICYNISWIVKSRELQKLQKEKVTVWCNLTYPLNTLNLSRGKGISQINENSTIWPTFLGRASGWLNTWSCLSFCLSVSIISFIDIVCT